MAKFSGKNIEFKDNQKAIFGTGDDSSIYYDGTDLNISTTVKGIDPTKKEHLTTKHYVDATISGVEFPSILQFGGSPTYNGTIDLLGWHIQTNTGESLSSGGSITTNVACFGSYPILDVLSTVGAPFTITVSGTVADDETGTYSQDYDLITVTGTGHYHGVKQFIDAPIISIVEASKSCTLDVYKDMHWNYEHRDFAIIGVCLGWVPDQNNWSVDLTIYHHNSTDDVNIIDVISFSSSDAVLRADANEPGKYLKANIHEIVYGSAGEGIIITMDQSGIGSFRLEVYYETEE